jgi:hypothetical protein
MINSCSQVPPSAEAAETTAISKDSLIKRGSYLVTVMDCNTCHSPKKMGPQGPVADPDKLLSGFPAGGPAPLMSAEDMKKGFIIFNGDLTAYAGPWGTSFAANITSDGTGIGNWSLDQFKNAFRHGKYMGLNEERMIMPPMPWEAFSKLTDADIEAIFSYLKSTKPVNNVVPQFKPMGK